MKDEKDFAHAGELIRKNPRLKPPSAVQLRLIDASADIRQNSPEDISYQHTVLCQTGLPYRSTEERRWERRNGRVTLNIEAGSAYHPQQDKFVELPLPFGPKARLILIHLNSEAIRTRTPLIEVEDSMTAFVKLLQGGRDPNGPEIRKFKSQLSALSVATIRMAMTVEKTEQGARTRQINTNIVRSMDVWFPKSPSQRLLWPSTVELSQEYFDTLVNHAVPLDQRAVAALAHSAMALDIYAWLAQRLCRIPSQSDALVPWLSLHHQFGLGYASRIRKFRQVFLKTLKDVLQEYPAAKVRPSQEGLILKASAPPIQRLPARLAGR
jgi:Plasmid encoded RepA protein